MHLLIDLEIDYRNSVIDKAKLYKVYQILSKSK